MKPGMISVVIVLLEDSFLGYKRRHSGDFQTNTKVQNTQPLQVSSQSPRSLGLDSELMTT